MIGQKLNPTESKDNSDNQININNTDAMINPTKESEDTNETIEISRSS